jgi:hypothetical protein
MIEVKDARICTDDEGGDSEYDFSQMAIHVGQTTYVLDLPSSMKRKEAEKFAKDYTVQIRSMVGHVQSTARGNIRRKLRSALGI